MTDARHRDDPGDVLDLRHPLHRCPRCHSEDLKFVSDGETANFLCAQCGRCWHVELGWVHRVDPTTCRGCDYRDRCAGAWSADHPVVVSERPS